MNTQLSRRIYRGIERFWMKHRVPIAIVTLVSLFLLIYVWNDIAVSIGAGQQGVLWNRFSGTVVETSYDEGMHLVFPWNKMTTYDLRVQEREDSITLLTIDGMAMKVYYSVLFRPLQQELGYVHKTVGPQYYTTLIEPMVVAAIRQVIGGMRTEAIIATPEDTILAYIQKDIYSGQFRYQSEEANRGEIKLVDTAHVLPREMDTGHQQLIVEDLINLFQVNVKIHTLVLPPQVQEAINEKLLHEQSEESYQFRISREQKEGERKRIEAQGIRDFEKISGISMLQWRGIEATEELAKSPNSKIIIVGTGRQQLPVLLNGEGK